ncbi:phage antirepressor protein [Pseudomonas sp. AA27]|uniref:BRO-N domain-containing protein n=1 Tax=Pseudomonas sp. AA27 TaxID=2908652 RepID=UPI001F2BF987|nr:BRO family protein [Pseudomonas sp. AA27]MCF1487596.1 phage antirepressor protein [Pseudomonas sp. AA27]
MSRNSGHEKAPVVGATEASEINAVIYQENNVMANNSTKVVPFNFGKQQVRTLLIAGEPWFAAQDVLDSLEYAETYKPSRAMSHVPDAWKGVHRLHTPGGTQQTLMISEQGLYFVLGRSDKPKALPFQIWLAGDVLPAIRKTGRYDDQHGRLATLIGQTIGTDGFHMLGAIVKGKVASLPAPVQRRATAKIWSQVHAAFGVRSAADIPAEHLDGARNFIASYAVVEGEFLPKRDQVQIVGGPQKRYLVAFNYKGEQAIEEIPHDAYVLTQRDLMACMVATPGDVPVSTPDMFQFLMAAVMNLKSRYECMARRAGA